MSAAGSGGLRSRTCKSRPPDPDPVPLAGAQGVCLGQSMSVKSPSLNPTVGGEPEQTGLGPNDVRQGNLACERGLIYKGPGPSGQDGSAGRKTGGEDT